MSPTPAALPRLVGMVHLHPLPGSPSFAGDIAGVISDAVADAVRLAEAGFDAVCVENFGDVPFFADDVPKVTIAAMTAAVQAVRGATSLPLMVNVLRNDALGALAIAAVSGVEMIRVNVLSGSMWTDQGVIHSRAAEIGRLRCEIAPDTLVLGDVFVKHATPPPGVDLTQATLDLVERGGADAVIVSGSGTGSPPTLDTVKLVRSAAGDHPVYLGSGVSHESVADFLGVADGVIVGSALKVEGVATHPIDPSRAAAFVSAANN